MEKGEPSTAIKILSIIGLSSRGLGKNFKSLWSVCIPDSINCGSIQENQGGRSGGRQNHFPNGEAEKNTQAASA
jgi:hypothetical protein